MANTVFEDVFEDELGLVFCEWVPQVKAVSFAGINDEVMTGFDAATRIDYKLNMRVRFCAKDNCGLVIFSLQDVDDSVICKSLEMLLRSHGYKFVLPFTNTAKAQLIRAAIMYFDNMSEYLRLISPCKPEVAGELRPSHERSAAA